MTRNGKIARLPAEVRWELNRRLYEGMTHPEVVKWVNELPAVQKMLAAKFGGQPIIERNVSAWKLGGYTEWLAKRELLGGFNRMDETAMGFREEHEERRGMRMESALQNLGLCLGMRFAGALEEWDKDPFSEKLKLKYEPLQSLTRMVVSLQLAEVRSERLQFQVAKQMEVDRVQNDDFEERAWKWAEQPHIKKEIGESYNPKTQEQLVKEQDVMVREVFGLAPGTCVNNSSDEPDMRPRPRYPGEVVRDFGPKYTHTHDGIPFWKPGPGSPGYDRSKVNPDGSMGPILRAPPPPVFDRNGRLIKPSPTTEEWAAQSGQVIPLHGASGASAPPMGDKEKEKSQAGVSTPPPSQGAEKRVDDEDDDEDEDDKKQQPKKQKPKKDTRTKAERRIDEEMGREGPFMSEEEYQEDPNFDYEAAEASLFGSGGSKVGVLPHGSMGEGAQGTQRTEGTKNGVDDDDDDDDEHDKNKPQREGPKGEALEALREQFSRQIRERKLERDIENEVISPQERARRFKVVSLSVKYKVPSPMRGPNNEIFPDIPPEVRRQYGVPEEEYFSKEWEVGGANAPQ